MTLVARRVEFLTGYQNAAYARAYADFVEKVRRWKRPLGKTPLAEAVARYLFKLMAYKDEYEVARLHTDPSFLARVTPSLRVISS
jgi:indolepyruvate ferredoxin oxidoreductase